jgi:hypothetical protein
MPRTNGNGRSSKKKMYEDGVKGSEMDKETLTDAGDKNADFENTEEVRYEADYALQRIRGIRIGLLMIRASR